MKVYGLGMELNENTKRLVYSAALSLLFVVLLFRFAYIQLYKGDEFFNESESNRVRIINIEPPRGLILDRYKNILVDNRPAYAVYAVPSEIENNDTTFRILSAALTTTPQEIKARLDRTRRGRFTPVKIERQIDFAALSLLYERRLELPGVDFRVESRRAYPRGVKAPHLFGYLGEITDAELDNMVDSYEPGDLVGKKGVERRYELTLHGQKGKRYVQVDAVGRIIGDLTSADDPRYDNIDPIPGKNLLLSLDASLQYFLEQRLTGIRGGAVVLNCKNGEVIAMVSKPDFDIELFSRPVTSEVWTQLINDPEKPLYDRMVQSLYPPGSTFKLILAIAGLETGLIDPEERVFCPGYYRFGSRTFDCWRKGGHGTVNLLQAIEQSCNVYFYRMGLKVGLKNWADYARRFGFGEATQIDLIGESDGLVPNEDYLDQRYGKNKWSKGLILNLAVGQGDLLATPLQMAYFAMTLANEGNTFRPHLKRGVQDPSSGIEEYTPPDSVHIQPIRPETYALIKRGMLRVVYGDHGTARSAAVRGITVAGKTGTAQNPHGEPHAWFIGFAPFDDPQIAICIFIENGGGGGAVAAPIAHEIISLLLKENKLIPSPPLAVGRQPSP